MPRDPVGRCNYRLLTVPAAVGVAMVPRGTFIHEKIGKMTTEFE
jgi:hypothetical protein